MKKYIKISNTEEIEEQAFTLMGASTKRDDSSKIGFFGSGLKYALSVILRNEIPLNIYSGLNQIKITTKKEIFRKHEFNNIYINNKKTSMTKEMGVDWKLWFALREIYCNAIDEEEGRIEECLHIEPKKGETHFYLEITSQIEEVINSWDSYFTNNRKDIIFSCLFGKLFHGGKTSIIYRKGVQCYQSEYYESLFHYDLNYIKINESRVASDTYGLNIDIVDFLSRHSTKEVIQSLMDNYKNTYEETLYWEEAMYYNNLWLDIIDGRILIEDNIAGHFNSLIQRERCLILPHKMVTSLKKYFGDKVKTKAKQSKYDNFVVIDKTEKIEQILNSCLFFLSNADFKIKYAIKIAIFDEKHILGLAKDNQIILSERLFELGKKEIVCTILEEVFHLESGAADETREFQNHLIIKLVNVLEEKNKEYL